MTVMKIPQHFSLDVVDAIRRIVVAASNFLRSSSSFLCWIFYVGLQYRNLQIGTWDSGPQQNEKNSQFTIITIIKVVLGVLYSNNIPFIFQGRLTESKQKKNGGALYYPCEFYFSN